MSVDKTFVNAMCISRQKYLLGKEKINRLLDAASFEEAFRMLCEFGFGESDVAPLDYERLLFSETVALSSFVATYAPTDEVKAFCLAPRDYLNAEYLLRRQRVGLPDVQLAHGLIPLDRLQKGIDGAYNLLPSSLAAAVMATVGMMRCSCELTAPVWWALAPRTTMPSGRTSTMWR